MPHELFHDTEGKFRYRIKGRNGEIMASSEPYSSAGNAARGYKDLVTLILKEHGIDGGNQGAQSESAEDSEALSEDEEGKGETEEGPRGRPEGDQGAEASEGPNRSRHDEVPGDNPAALKDD